MALGDQVLLVGTNAEAFRLERRGTEYKATPLGLTGRGIIHWILADKDDPRTLYAATGREGVWRSTDGGGTWQERSRGITHRDVYSLAQHPTTGELYAGTEPSNIYRSTDRGESWTLLPGLALLPESREWFFPRAPWISHVRTIALDPFDPKDIFCCVEDGGFIHSTDGGETWKTEKDGVKTAETEAQIFDSKEHDKDAHTMSFIPGSKTDMVACTGLSNYRSEDAGRSWTESRTGVDRDRTYMTGLFVGRANEREVVIIGGANGSPGNWRAGKGRAALYRSDDRGRSYTRLDGGFPQDGPAGLWVLTGDPKDGNVFYAGLSDGTIWGTSDGGKSFNKIVELASVMGDKPGVWVNQAQPRAIEVLRA
jgi:photosystem II stability/assembly factor-like uncharacterized protein